MFLVAAIDPAADDARRNRILECVDEVFHDNLFVVIINHDKRCFAEILVSDGYFACHDVRQCVDEGRRARKEVFRVLNRRLIMRVRLQGCVSVKQNDRAILSRLEIPVSFNI